MNALRTGNRNVDLFVVAFLPTLIALVATSSERLRDVIRSAAGNGLRRRNASSASSGSSGARRAGAAAPRSSPRRRTRCSRRRSPGI